MVNNSLIPFISTEQMIEVDSGVPPGLYARPPLKLEIQALFAQEEILRIWWMDITTSF
ncbi:MAG: hypothetical protein ACC707_18765 [Thiohalomonadales bacterium]